MEIAEGEFRVCRLAAGYFKLASLVQYVPLPTVGGYLGYVGYFCLAAGINLACNVEVLQPTWACLSSPSSTLPCRRRSIDNTEY